MQKPDKMMMKVSLGVEAGTTPGTYALTASPLLLEFVYGAGARGVTLLETALDGLGVGDVREIQLEAAEVEGFFGHLYDGWRQKFSGVPLPATIFLRLTLKGWAEAEPREVVQALARSLAGGGCAGNCGCGCG